MPAKIISRGEKDFTVQVTIPFGGSMLENEETIQHKLNEVGQLATEEILSHFDTDGSPIKVGKVRFTSKGIFSQTYESPFGPTKVNRHVYQSSAGGRTYCPLEVNARLIFNSTPRFAKMVSFKYASFGANLVARDFLENHGRSIARGYVKDLSDMIGTIAQAKEEIWHYDLPEFSAIPATISIGLDGTSMYLQDDGWRMAMVGTIAFYDSAGERFHTIYIAASPEYGKSTFFEHFRKEIERVKAIFPDSIYIGLGDGAVDNWAFLKPFVKYQILDFFHVSEYVGKFAVAFFGEKTKTANAARQEWLEASLHKLKNDTKGALNLLEELKAKQPKIIGLEKGRIGQETLTYFKNHLHQMEYSRHVRKNRPIGSGVTEAACKVLVKQRLGQAGMRWKEPGASAVLTIRPLVLTPGRWNQFWSLISQYGIPA